MNLPNGANGGSPKSKQRRRPIKPRNGRKWNASTNDDQDSKSLIQGTTFFQPYVPEEFNLGAEDFDATLGRDNSSDILSTSPPLSSSPRIQAPAPQNQGLNFRAAARDNGLVVSSTEAFPTLGSATSNPSSGKNPTASSWGGAKPLQQQSFPALSSPVTKKAPGGKKKGKGGSKGQLLFSTGGQRGSGYR
mmetsp:Transcript_9441/g.22274  ORF Transcript_9441/g.22274 Transcript_9441/m.22274 type:complete len:190 (-) Transcript_9441:30-599(-)